MFETPRERWPALGATPKTYREPDGVGLVLAGTLFATEGDTLEAAVADMVDALREYAQDWPRLSQAPQPPHDGRSRGIRRQLHR